MSTVALPGGLKETEREQNEGRLLDSQNSTGKEQAGKITQLLFLILFMKNNMSPVRRPEPEGRARTMESCSQDLNLMLLAQLGTISQQKLLRAGDLFFLFILPSPF